MVDYNKNIGPDGEFGPSVPAESSDSYEVVYRKPDNVKPVAIVNPFQIDTAELSSRNVNPIFAYQQVRLERLERESMSQLREIVELNAKLDVPLSWPYHYASSRVSVVTDPFTGASEYGRDRLRHDGPLVTRSHTVDEPSSPRSYGILSGDSRDGEDIEDSDDDENIEIADSRSNGRYTASTSLDRFCISSERKRRNDMLDRLVLEFTHSTRSQRLISYSNNVSRLVEDIRNCDGIDDSIGNIPNISNTLSEIDDENNNNHNEIYPSSGSTASLLSRHRTIDDYLLSLNDEISVSRSESEIENISRCDNGGGGEVNDDNVTQYDISAATLNSRTKCNNDNSDNDSPVLPVGKLASPCVEHNGRQDKVLFFESTERWRLKNQSDGCSGSGSDETPNRVVEFDIHGSAVDDCSEGNILESGCEGVELRPRNSSSEATLTIDKQFNVDILGKPEGYYDKRNFSTFEDDYSHISELYKISIEPSNKEDKFNILGKPFGFYDVDNPPVTGISTIVSSVNVNPNDDEYSNHQENVLNERVSDSLKEKKITETNSVHSNEIGKNNLTSRKCNPLKV